VRRVNRIVTSFGPHLLNDSFKQSLLKKMYLNLSFFYVNVVFITIRKQQRLSLCHNYKGDLR